MRIVLAQTPFYSGADTVALLYSILLGQYKIILLTEWYY